MAGKKSAVNPNNSETPIEIMKEDTCPTSSGKSTLGYQIGTDDSGAIHLKVSGNDGGGMFSPEWVNYTAIQAAIEAWPMAVVSKCGRMISPAAKCPGRLGTW